MKTKEKEAIKEIKECDLKLILLAIREEYRVFESKPNHKNNGEYWKIRADSLERALKLIDKPEKT